MERVRITYRPLVSPVLLLFLLGCSSSDSSSDPNATLWTSHCKPLLDGEYQACYGPGWDKGVPHDRSRFSFYEVNVEKPKGDRSFTVLFEKKFAATEVSPQLLTREEMKVVDFDSSSKRVTFDVGRKRIHYIIDPAHVAGGENTQLVKFTGSESVFRVVATATAHVTVEPPFMLVRLEQGTIRATARAIGPQHITGYRVNLAAATASGGWDMPRKSEHVPVDVMLDPLATTILVPRTLTIPIDGMDSLTDNWLVFEVDVDATPPAFTYSHGQRLTVHE